MKARAFVVILSFLILGAFCLPLSAQTPPIQWTPPSIEKVMYAGQTIDVRASFSSSQDLGPVGVFLVPALAGFLSVSPRTATFNVSKGVAYTLMARIQVPSATALGTIVEGT